MNEPSAQFDPSASQSEDLQDEVQSLRLMLCAALALMMVFGGCVDLILLKQAADLRSAVGKAQLALEAAPPVPITQYVDFWNKLNEYSKTHPELAPLMTGANRFVGQTLLNPAYLPKKK
jgi:hypothetical protein